MATHTIFKKHNLLCQRMTLASANFPMSSRSGEWTLEYTFKWGMTHHGCDIHAYLKEFPYQVFENIVI